MAIAAALALLPGVAAARDMAELDCLRPGITPENGGLAYEALKAGKAAPEAVTKIIVDQGTVCALRYNWPGPAARVAGRYFATALLLDYIRSQFAARPEVLAKLDASFAVTPESLRAGMNVRGAMTEDDRNWLRTQVSASGVPIDSEEGAKAIAYLIAAIQRAKHVEDWKAL